MKDNTKFIWSCTKFLAMLLCALSSTVWWVLGSGGAVLFVLVGYVALFFGLLFAVLTYVTDISPVIKQENSENED